MSADTTTPTGGRDGAAGAGPAAATSTFRRVLARVEDSTALDPLVRRVEPLAMRIVADDRLRGVLHGDATGIPMHPVLTDVPFGAWFMAEFLDFFPDEGMRRAATRLVGLGVLGAAPTAFTGWAEWALSDRGTRRVGIVHAAANAVGTLVFLSSWVARKQGRHAHGVWLARIGGAVVIVGGFLGGYLGRERTTTG